MFAGFSLLSRARRAAGFVCAMTLLAGACSAQAAPLYPGEDALYEKAADEGLVVSFDTGPEWANWKSLFAEFRKRYPKVEITYNDIGSAATVVALDKARRRPQADTAYYFAASALDAVNKDVVAPFKPLNFDKLPPVFRDPEGRWFTVHSLNIAFLVNRKLVKNVPTGWADLLKPEYRNSLVYLDRARPARDRWTCSPPPTHSAAASTIRNRAPTSSASCAKRAT